MFHRFGLKNKLSNLIVSFENIIARVLQRFSHRKKTPYHISNIKKLNNKNGL